MLTVAIRHSRLSLQATLTSMLPSLPSQTNWHAPDSAMSCQVLLATTLEAGRHIDWAFVRGPVQADAGKVHRSVRGSDHYPISFELRGASSGL